MRHLTILLTLHLILALCPAVAGQSHFPPGDSTARDATTAVSTLPDSTASDGPASLFKAIERGLSEGDVRLIAPYFSRTVPLNVRGSAPGYYSANQAGEVIRHFLSAKKLSPFSFTTIGEGEHPFATGAARVTADGQVSRVQVYVRLSRDKSGWVITQFNIY